MRLLQHTVWLQAVVVMITAHAAAPLRADDFDSEPIRYSTTAPENPVSRLSQRIETGELVLERDKEHGYLKALLRELGVPASSQTLVYSKTSLQRNRIAPWRPRALYFNDDVYVGYCQGGEVLEVSTADPQLGAVFYSLDQTEETPVPERQTDSCLICHGSSQNQGFPGHLLRSLYVNAGGEPVFSMGSHRIDQTSPFEKRWGGWYVTGTHGDQTHLGNLIVRGNTRQPEQVDNAAGQNVSDLSSRFTTSAYLTPHSDIVALLVLEHQAEMHNRITRAGFQTRMALHHERVIKEAFEEPLEPHTESTLRRIRSACEPLVEYMLFSGEAELKGKIEGTSNFAEEFAARGPKDSRGRSLREFDLERRVFKYPCSYLIYSEAFEGLPDEAQKYVKQRLDEILSGEDESAAFAHLTSEDRQAIREILRDTGKGS